MSVASPRAKIKPVVIEMVRPAAGHRTQPAGYFRWKPHVSRVLAALLLIPGLPLIGLLCLVVRITSRGPAIYRQLRVGRHGTLFTMLKIRTMRHDAERISGPTWTQVNDPRTTRMGRLLRKLHLDELPQLINVLRGEMDLIGPRPERPEFTQVLAREIPGYLDRLEVLPGITGLAQVNLPPDTDLESVRRKLVLDLDYVRTGNAWLDFRMMFCTSLRLLGIPGEWAMRIAMVRRGVGSTSAIHRQDAAQAESVTPSNLLSRSSADRLAVTANASRAAAGNGHAASTTAHAAGGNGSYRSASSHSTSANGNGSNGNGSNGSGSNGSGSNGSGSNGNGAGGNGYAVQGAGLGTAAADGAHPARFCGG
jgi:lipopolysaccharide/colanic/teichoic acid biosynthesis glycosyltransferase